MVRHSPTLPAFWFGQCAVEGRVAHQHRTLSFRPVDHPEPPEPGALLAAVPLSHWWEIHLPVEETKNYIRNNLWDIMKIHTLHNKIMINLQLMEEIDKEIIILTIISRYIFFSVLKGLNRLIRSILYGPFRLMKYVGTQISLQNLACKWF